MKRVGRPTAANSFSARKDHGSRRRLAGTCSVTHFPRCWWGNGEDVKTAQSLLRHANVGITLALYTHPVGSKKQEVQSKVVENDSTAGSRASCCKAKGYGL